MKNSVLKKAISFMLCFVMVFSIINLPASLLVAKATELTSEEQIQSVVDMIDAIGTVVFNDDCHTKIVSAEKAYNSLSDEQQTQVENYNVLVSARNDYDILEVDSVDTSELTKARSGVINNTINWCYYTNGLLEISGTGSIPSYSSSNTSPWYNYKDSIKTILVRKTISEISASAFYGCDKVTEITLPFVGKKRGTSGSVENGFQDHIGYIFGYTKSDSYSSHSDNNRYSAYLLSYNYSYYYSINSDNKDKYYYWTYNIPSTLKRINITNDSQIADCAFKNCSNIESISLKNSISSIGKYAFCGCSALQSCALPASVSSLGEYAFYNDSSLTEMFISDNISRIEPFTFYQCSSISKLRISESITYIGEKAFYNDSSIKEIVIPDNTKTIEAYAFAGCSNNTADIILPPNMESLGIYAFYNNSKSIALYISEGLITIPNNAFENCSSLGTVSIPNSVTNIGVSAFKGCNSIVNITLPFVGTSRTATGYESHFGYIFGYTTSRGSSINDSYKSYTTTGTLTLKDTAGNTVYKTITTSRSSSNVSTDFIYSGTSSSSPWYSCLTGMYEYETTSNSSKTYSNYDRMTDIVSQYGHTYHFYWYWYGQLQTYYYNVPNTLKNVNVTDAVKLENGAFNNCQSITNINLNNGISYIGAYAFQNVPWLSNQNETFSVVGDGVLIKYSGNSNNVVLPDTVKYIGGAVFENNSNISSVSITDNVNGIGDYAFNGCDSLSSLTIPNTVKKIGNEFIPDSCSLSVYKPSSGYNYARGRSTGSYNIINDANGTYTTGQDTFYYKIKNGFAEIIGCYTKSTEITVPEEINGVIVKRIDDYGFANCTTINSITIPSNIESIGRYAFEGCTGLINATIPTTVDSVGDYAFNNCTNLKNVTISEGVKSIGKGCFSNCTSLVEAVVPDTCESLGSYAFYNCTAMTSATIGINACEVDDYTFYNCNNLSTIVIGTSVERIGEFAFYDCALSRVTVPSTVKEIDKYAFYDNSVLSKVTLKNNLLTIGCGSFKNCENLVNITIPSTVVNIGISAFENCKKLPSIGIPIGVTVINDYTFSNCSLLSEVTLSSNLTIIGKSAFYNNAFSSIEIPNTVTRIDKYAFRDCKNLISFYAPDSVKSIGNSAFYDCSSLKEVSISDGVQGIGDSAFKHNDEIAVEVRYCYGKIADNLFAHQDICHVVLDENIKNIGNLAFAYCYYLENITYNNIGGSKGEFIFSENVIQIGNEAFKDATLLKSLIIPDTIQKIGTNVTYNSITSKHNVSEVKISFYNVEGSIAANILKEQKVSYIYISDGISEIGDNAFSGCSILKRIYLPDTIESCGSSVFANSSGKVKAYFRGVDGTIEEQVYKEKASGLNTLIFDENIDTIGRYAFYGSDTIQNVNIKNTDTIGDYAFASSTSITKVNIENVNTIGEYAFNNNSASNSLVITTAETIGKNAFSDSSTKSVNIGSVITVDDNAFSNDISLKTVIVNSVESINNYAFYNDIEINNIKISNAIKNIGDHAFEECKLIPKLALPDTLRTIGEYAFYNCNSLGSINIPSGVETINNYTFFGCASLLSVELPDTITSVGDYAYYGCVLVNPLNLGNSVETIGEYAFYNCNAAKVIELPGTLTTIGNYAFRGCSGITTITIPNSVTDLGDCVFYACTKLEEAYIGLGVTSIGDRVFYGCVSLAKAQLEGNVSFIHDLAFYGAEDVTVYEYENSYIENYCTENDIPFVNIGHNYVLTTIPATCTTDGGNRYVCTGCGDSYLESTIPAFGHTLTTDAAVEPTCTKTGLTEGTHCSVCGATITAQQEIPAAGHSYESVVTEPTCKSQGYTTHTCSVCGDTYVDNYTDIDPDAHSYGGIVTEPTCTEKGYTTYTCELCGNSYTDNEIAATGHSYESAVTKDATCTQAGVRTFTCSACGDSYTEMIPIIAHTPEIDVAIVPTCTATGLTEGSHCAVCGKILVAQEVVNANGHSYTAAITEPTCKDQGYTTYTCTVCGDSFKSDFTDVTNNHDYHDSITTPATCSSNGVRTFTCSVCGDNYTVPIPAIAHTPVIDDAVEPTCTETGLTEGSHCSVCGKILVAQETVSAKGHDYVVSVIEPTCRDKGYTSHTCSVCGDSYRDNYTDRTNNHDYNGVVTKQPTCAVEGVKTFTCSVCGDVYTEAIPVVDHTPVTDNAVEPTCTETGLTEGSHCSVCGAVFVEQEVVDAKGHDFNNYVYNNDATCTENGTKTAKCSRCDATDTIEVVDTALDHDYLAPEVVKAATVSEEGTLRHNCSRCDHYYDTVIPKAVPEGTTVTTENGNAIVEFDNGNIITVPENSSSIETFDNGTYLVNINEETNVTVSNGTTVSVANDGNVVITETVNNKTTAITVPSGSTVVKNEDGDYTVSIVTDSGVVEKTIVAGESITVEPDGKATCSGEHKYADGVITLPATCTSTGVKTYTCSVCGETKTESIDKLDHSVVIDKEVPATCTDFGHTAGAHCTVCGAIVVASETIAPTGNHAWNTGVITKKSTPTATGVKTYTCTVCGATKTETIAKCAKYANPIKASGKTATVKYSNLKKKNQTVAQKNAFSISKAQGKVTYTKASGNKNITVSSAGKITVKKGLKKGTYKVKVKVKVAGNATYKAKTVTVTVTIKVK